MLRRLLLVATAAILVAPVVGEPSPKRVRIVTDRGVEPSPIKLFFGGVLPLYAEIVPEDDSRPFRPLDALKGIEWWVYRTHDHRGDARPAAEEQPGAEVGHRTPGRSQWGLAPVPLLCPDDWRTNWSSGRYVVKAKHPRHGSATFGITIATLVLLDHEAKRTAGGYEAVFHVALADPDLDGAKVPFGIRTVDADGRIVDRLQGAHLARWEDGFRTLRRVLLSSRIDEETARARTDVTNDGAWPALRVVENGKMLVLLGDRVFEFSLPLEEGELVRRSGIAPFGREGHLLAQGNPTGLGARGASAGRGSRGRSGRAHPGRSNSGPQPGRAEGKSNDGDGRTWAGHPDTRARSGGLEIVSSAGRGRKVKVWMGESVRFAARRRARGLSDVFQPTRWLRDVYWTLTSESPPPLNPPHAIMPGMKSNEVGRLGPSGLWGAPPSIFHAPADVLGHWSPGRYRLRARSGDRQAEVVVDVAAFEVADVKANLQSDGYQATLRLRLEDPIDARMKIPVAVRVISTAGEILDYVRGVSLSRDLARRHYFWSERIYISSRVDKPCRSRYEETDPTKQQNPGGYPVLRATPGTLLRVVLDGAVFTYPLPLVVSEQITGRSGATDKPVWR